MSEQKAASYMQQLDAWTYQAVIGPLQKAAEAGDADAWNTACEGSYKAIRQKVLESYRNGQKAGIKPPVGRETRYAQTQTR